MMANENNLPVEYYYTRENAKSYGGKICFFNYSDQERMGKRPVRAAEKTTGLFHRRSLSSARCGCSRMQSQKQKTMAHPTETVYKAYLVVRLVV